MKKLVMALALMCSASASAAQIEKFMVFDHEVTIDSKADSKNILDLECRKSKNIFMFAGNFHKIGYVVFCKRDRKDFPSAFIYISDDKIMRSIAENTYQIDIDQYVLSFENGMKVFCHLSTDKFCGSCAFFSDK